MSDENSQRNTDDVTSWFEDVYQNRGRGPWSLHAPHPLLIEWVEREAVDTTNKHVAVTGCGEGDDAEYFSQQGYDVTAFDISPRAIAICKERFPDTTVNYVVGDLFNLPDDWQQHFDLVFDNRTIQSLPPDYTEQAIAGTASLVAEGGQLLIICWGRSDDSERKGVPWPLSHQDLNKFTTHGLTEIRFEDLMFNKQRRFRVTYHRPS